MPAAESVESKPTAAAAPAEDVLASSTALRNRLAAAVEAGTNSAVAGTSSPRYWRSFSDLAETPDFQDFLHREFPQQASEWHDPVSRRNFLKLMGASVALAGVGAGCYKHPPEKIVPYVVPPEYHVQGKPLYFATAMPFNGYGQGLLVESYSFRPTKIEGNPKHPASLGGTTPISQASILNLYDPDRSQAVREAGRSSTKYSTFLTALNQFITDKGGPEKVRLRILTETVTSPSLIAHIGDVKKKFPQLVWHQYQPVNNDNANEGARLAFGRPLHAVHHFDQATRIVSLDCNFLQDDPGSVRFARDYINGRRIRVAEAEGGHGGAPRREVAEAKPVSAFKPVEGEASMNRLYVFESTATITGASADHRKGLRARDIGLFARALASKLGVAGVNSDLPALEKRFPDAAKWIDEIAKDLTDAKGTGLVLAGRTQPAAVHALAHAMNAAIGAVGKGVTYTEPLEQIPESRTQTQSIRDLRDAMKGKQVDLLLILGGNPAYDTPADVNFATVLSEFSSEGNARQTLAVHLSSHYDETSFLCRWHIPHSHYLESWGDVRAYDGTISIIQPLIAPLFPSQTPYDLLNALLADTTRSTYETLRDFWRPQVPQGQDFDGLWQTSLHNGFIEGTAAPAIAAPAIAANFAAGLGDVAGAAEPAGTFEMVFRPDPHLWDGRFANNAWLQELPKPLSKVVWDNAAYMSFNTAKKLNLDVSNQERPQLIELTPPGGSYAMRVPVCVQFGYPEDSITVHLGFGRERAGRVGGEDGETRAGFNAYKLRSSESPEFVSGLKVRVTNERMHLATTQDHQVIDDERREIIKAGTLGGLKQEIAAAKGQGDEHKVVHLSLYANYDYTRGHRWGMVIDQTACIGCNACVVACQAENNIPTVGKEQVEKSREMHWLRIDTYYGTTVREVQHSLDNPDVYFQPMLCQHCEQAPCEVVCPVAATTHSNEGINEMTYNRCIGTRYCSNNCPYKVRRFNFLQFTDRDTQLLKLQRNPYVTVRNRGVMEKCTFCIQRINQTRIEEKKAIVQLDEAKENGDEVKSKQLASLLDELFVGLQTACQQACPTEAIVFGDLNRIDSTGRQSEVARLRGMEGLDYTLLDELNTRPRLSYHAKLRNTNDALAMVLAPGESGHRRETAEAEAEAPASGAAH